MKKITFISFLLNLFISNQIFCQIEIPSNNVLKSNVKSIKYQYFLLPNSNLLLSNEYRSIESFVATVDDYKSFKNQEFETPDSKTKRNKDSIMEAAEIMDAASNMLNNEIYGSFQSTEYETVVNYNPKGLITQLLTKNINSHILLKENYKYDVNNNLLNFTKFESKNPMDDFAYLDESEFVTIFSEENYKYDSKGHIIEKISTKAGLEEEKTIEQYIFNSNNELITTKTSKAVNGEKEINFITDETKNRCITKKNNDGLTIKNCTGDFNKYEETYDKNNRLIKYVNNGIFKQTKTYQYLDDELISETFYDEKNVATTKVSNTYDDFKRLDGKIITHFKNGIKINYIFRYDSSGNLYEINENNFKTTFKFDKKGNWILKIVEVQDKESVEVTQRIISYY